MIETYQSTLEGDKITLIEFEDRKASIQNKLASNKTYWRKLDIIVTRSFPVFK